MLRYYASALLLVPAIGCEPPAADHTFYVAKGTVNKADGKPLHRATMKFTPEDPKTGREDLLLIENGQYNIKLMPAKYKVSFEQLPAGAQIPKKYLSPTTSTFELDATRDVEANFELK
jgi:hypothetical protein